MPKITAKAVKLNSYVADEKPLVLSGGTVSSLTQLDGFDFVQLVENDGGWALRYTGRRTQRRAGR